MSSPAILSLLSTRVSVDPPHLVLRRELARRQAQGADVPQAAVTARRGTAPAADAGAYAIRNLSTGRVYVGGDLDVQVGLEWDRAALKNKQHRNAALQAEWDWFGEEKFTFKVVARIAPGTARDTRGKLMQVVESVREELGSYGATGYNRRVKALF